VRVTATPTGVVVDGPSAGRGAWLCRSTEQRTLVVIGCLEAAIARRAFARAWRGPVDREVELEIRRVLGVDVESEGGPDVP
jgi:predicted RNA-binding protein YlxR (DUF448 family)